VSQPGTTTGFDGDRARGLGGTLMIRLSKALNVFGNIRKVMEWLDKADKLKK
jgi:hypothetical protein